MTIQELIDQCTEAGISFDTQIAVRAKDDYLITKESVYLDRAYFGNCADGTAWEEANMPKDEDGDPDYDSAPQVLILNSGRG